MPEIVFPEQPKPDFYLEEIDGELWMMCRGYKCHRQYRRDELDENLRPKPPPTESEADPVKV